jgi:hypothetical protein
MLCTRTRLARDPQNHVLSNIKDMSDVTKNYINLVRNLAERGHGSPVHRFLEEKPLE